MRRGIQIGLAALCVTMATATAAHAKDLCLGFAPDVIFVGKDFKVPGRGKCKPWQGFLLTTFSNVSISTGTGCTSSDGATLRLHLSSVRENSAFEDYIQLPLPSLTNGTDDEFITGPPASAGHVLFTGFGRTDCGAKRVPIP